MQSKIQNISWLILLLVIPFTARAQYRSVFGKNSSSWNILNTGQVDFLKSDSFFYTHDSARNGKIYKVIQQEHLGSTYLYLLREDTATGKVWGISHTDSSEVEIMDMTLHVGDKFYFNPSYGLKVTSIFTRKDRVYILFENDPAMHDTLYFIEGIGPTKGLFYSLEYNSSRDYLLCAHQDDSLTYLNNSHAHWGGKCSYTEVGIFDRSYNKPAIAIYPNPSTESITFSFDNQTNEKNYLYIYDGLGRKTEAIETSENRIILEKGNKTAGIYYYELVRDGAIVQSGKLKFL